MKSQNDDKKFKMTIKNSSRRKKVKMTRIIQNDDETFNMTIQNSK